jgi:hypothetical protein
LPDRLDFKRAAGSVDPASRVATLGHESHGFAHLDAVPAEDGGEVLACLLGACQAAGH